VNPTPANSTIGAGVAGERVGATGNGSSFPSSSVQSRSTQPKSVAASSPLIEPSRDEPAKKARRSARRTVAVLAGVGVALVVFGAGALFVTGRTEEYAATGSFVVLPGTTTESIAAGLYDTLGRGQVVSTFAEIIRSAPISDTPVGATTSVTISPDTLVIVVEGRASTAAAAEAIAQSKMESGAKAVVALGTPFRIDAIDEPAGSAELQGLSDSKLLIAVILAAIILGIAAFQAVEVVRRASASPIRR
jgi:hypothetical protein